MNAVLSDRLNKAGGVTLLIVSFLILGLPLYHDYGARRGLRAHLAYRDQLAELSFALARYKYAHAGQLPERLSDLVPTFVSTNDLWLFFPPRLKRTIRNQSQSPEFWISNIATTGAFIYLGERGARNNLVLYERPEMISDQKSFGNAHPNMIAFVRSDFSGGDMTIAQLETKLGEIK